LTDQTLLLPGSETVSFRWTGPDSHSPVLNAALDLTHNQPELVLGIMRLRHQLMVLERE
jgi:hypothetical protein